MTDTMTTKPDEETAKLTSDTGTPTASSMRLFIRITKPCAAIALVVSSILILILSQHTYSNAHAHFKDQQSSSTTGSILPITVHDVQMDVPGFGTGTSKQNLSFYTCGFDFDSNDESDSSMGSNDFEILLLHGAKFTKENWKDSDILNSLCLKGNDNKLKRRTSVVAADLHVSADANGIHSAFRSLTEANYLTGRPLVVITPSASGKSVVSLMENNANDNGAEAGYLSEIVQVWVPVASPAVLSINDENVFSSFKSVSIPVLAINGDKDKMGEKVTDTLVNMVGAKGVELKGTHPVYLDSPEAFVETLFEFLYGMENVSR